MTETLSHKPTIILTEEDLAQVERILEFGIILFFAWLVSDSVLESLRKATYAEPVAVIGKWIAFFVVLLIYYKLIRVYIKAEKEL